MAAPRGDRRDLYIGERAGRIVLVRGGKRRKRPFLDLRTIVSRPHADSEEGFLSLVFAPGFRKNRRLFVSYSTRRGTERIEEWRANRSGTRVVTGSRRTLLELPHPKPQHFGGNLQFGPGGKLYVGIGDGGEGASSRRAQKLSNLYGKILRIDPRPGSGGAPYRIPRGNPFARTAGARPEIWLYGVRNPWRFAFAPGSRDLIVADVGEQQREELDWLPGPAAGRGVNLGWDCREGAIPYERAESGCTAPGALAPSFDYSHFSPKRMPRVKPGRRVRPPSKDHRVDIRSGCAGAIMGGYVVRDPQLRRYRGRFVFGDYCSGGVYYAARRKSGTVAVYGLRQIGPYTLVSFGEDGCGRLYAVQTLGGIVKRLQRRHSSCKR